MTDAVKALFDAVQETVEQIAPSSGADPTPLSEDDAATLILWTYQVLRDDVLASGGIPDDRALVVGPCGALAEVPKVEIRPVETADGPRVELALLSHAYCWRVRSWWTPDAAAGIADELRAAAGSPPPTPGPTRERVSETVMAALVGHDPDSPEAFDAITDAVTVLLSTQAVTVRPEDIPAEIKALIDERAEREHSADGSVMTTLAEVLTLWEQHKVGGV